MTTDRYEDIATRLIAPGSQHGNKQLRKIIADTLRTEVTTALNADSTARMQDEKRKMSLAQSAADKAKAEYERRRTELDKEREAIRTVCNACTGLEDAVEQYVCWLDGEGPVEDLIQRKAHLVESWKKYKALNKHAT